ACPGGCVYGAGMPFTAQGDEKKTRSRIILQADEAEAISLPSESPVVINLYEKYLPACKEFNGEKLFHTHFEKRNVLL
ncbi:MAG: iron hydrogenase small subunit, partial [Bacteroidales bacterium]|nr:iron hydrogenase small subunit [Bacteroidales bacterium]